MKENNDINELLNGFIDGQLDVRQHTEVQRLIAHDPQLTQKLQQLQKTKMLVAALPRTDAPPGMLEDIKAALEKRSLLAAEADHSDYSRGRRQLLMRKMAAVAAMVALIAVLAALVYSIIAPRQGPQIPLTATDWPQPAPRDTGAEKIAAVHAPQPRTVLTVPDLRATLELRTVDLAAADELVLAAIKNCQVLDAAENLSTLDNKASYSLNCSRQQVNCLLSSLQNIWPRFDSAALLVDTAPPHQRILVQNVTARQISEIADQHSLEGSLKAAKYFAVMNSIAAMSDKQTAYDAGKDSDTTTIPRPALTSAAETVKNASDKAPADRMFGFTIVLTGTGPGQ
ncbi:MAG TPA: hypothetical protein VMW23_06555 [Sedimentisphaerales bacterium]|nr:hypothetical protein [Sedimentisphaerales bacterium]